VGAKSGIFDLFILLSFPDPVRHFQGIAGTFPIGYNSPRTGSFMSASFIIAGFSHHLTSAPDSPDSRTFIAEMNK